ncbi:MAG: hypothetical protein DHS20C10_10780 [marine bacterium B5-7]|nr:MAG: hypothetical protein DHS20C10_10780 [marine bacterium B5-7]
MSHDFFKETPELSKRHYFLSLGLLLVIVIPFLVVWSLFYHHNPWLLAHTKHHGQFISPPLPVEKLQLTTQDNKHLRVKNLNKKWWLVYVEPENCNSHCLHNLHNMNQLHLALGRDHQRMGRLVIVRSKRHAKQLQAQIIQHAPGTHVVINAQRHSPLQTEDFYIIDPEGNIMLHYQDHAGAQGILKDMRRLLHGNPDILPTQALVA